MRLSYFDKDFGNRSELIALATYFTGESMRLVSELLVVRNGCRRDIGTVAWECLERSQLIEAIIVLKSGFRPEHQDLQLVASQAK